MTQVELPQLSLRRYLDLVKRRRWQLVPVSLLGLVVGGLIAFFIPRYFVAETLLVHQQVPSEEKPDIENPFRAIVDTAKSTIPLAVHEALDEPDLNWPELALLDAFGREQFERDLESRIKVLDINVWDRSRTYAQLRVQYRDRDGARSASLLNTLVRVWIKKRLEELREPAQQQSQQAKEDADRWRRIYDNYVRERQDLERQYDIKPNYDISLQRAELPNLTKAQKQQQEDLRNKKVDRTQREQRLLSDQQKLAEMPQRVPPDATRLEELAAKTPEGRELLLRAQYYQTSALITFKAGTEQHRTAMRAYEMAMSQLKAIVPQAQADADGLVPNADYVELQAKIAQDQQELRKLVTDIELIEMEVEVERLRLESLIEGFGRYESKLRDIEEAKRSLGRALDSLRSADELLGKLQSNLPVDQVRPAQVPPAPTEPNIVVVAMAGCILGLGAAIGLILLLDFLQGTFKTVDDVERGLPVPVLGGISHLETDEQRQTVVRSRRRASLVAAALLVLITMVVSVFYIDPTRLPAVVRDLLAMLLGA